MVSTGSGNNRGSSSINSTLGSKMVSTGSGNSRLISRGHSSVGVRDKSGDMERSTVRSNNRGSDRQSRSSSSYNGGRSSINSTLSGKMVSTSGSNSRLISRGHSPVGVRDKSGDMERSTVSSNNRGSNRNSRGSSSYNGGRSSIDSSLGSKMVSTSSGNSRLISRGHSSVGVRDKSGDMERSTVSSNSRDGGSNNGSSNRSSSIDSTLSSKMFSTGS